MTKIPIFKAVPETTKTSVDPVDNERQKQKKTSFRGAIGATIFYKNHRVRINLNAPSASLKGLGGMSFRDTEGSEFSCFEARGSEVS